MKKKLLSLVFAVAIATPLFSAEKNTKPTTQTSTFQDWLFEGKKLFTEGFEKALKHAESEFDRVKQQFSFFGPKAETHFDEKNNKLIVEIKLPGYDVRNITVKTKEKDSKNVLVVVAKKEKTETTETTTPKGEVEKTEKEMEKVSCETALPANAIIEKIKPVYKNGLLTIDVPVKTEGKIKENIIPIQTQ